MAAAPKISTNIFAFSVFAPRSPHIHHDNYCCGPGNVHNYSKLNGGLTGVINNFLAWKQLLSKYIQLILKYNIRLVLDVLVGAAPGWDANKAHDWAF